MELWIEQWLQHCQQLGGGLYAAVAVLIALETVFPPLPSELILTMTGFLTAQSPRLSVVGATVAATVGALAGAWLWYGVGRWCRPDRLAGWLESPLCRRLRLKRTDVERAVRRFQQHGHWTVLFCRFVPVLRSLISLPAGMAAMPLPAFLSLTAAGSLLWNALLVGLGAAFGASWHTVGRTVGTVSLAVTVAGAVSAAIAVAVWRRRAAKK